MARFKDFGSGSTSEAREPITFDLHGESFEAFPEIQGALLIELVKDSSSDDPAVTADIIVRFFSQVLTDESYERFDALIKSKDKIVHVETLGEITGWLVEEYSNRPEEPREA